MWSSRPASACARRWISASVLSLAALTALSGCTVEPLNARTTPAAAKSDAEVSSVRQALRATEVSAARERVEQQVRNALLFSMNGGNPIEPSLYRVQLAVRSADSGVAVEAGVAAATAAQVSVIVSYTITEKSTNRTLASGTRTALSAYNRTPQKFANQRAARDAENRAAKDVAEQIRLVVAQTVAGN
ncbi:hypothetical protein ACFQ14_09925 [Pseudahrensia aquimaris]|uniref:LPS-assembly lipoprotein n=1 Tax=Pseudahrensia aquimaris TaxID=744461 RepID=A0ABW3FHL5_9HYPH